jgi:hypothetical protein
MLDGELEDLCRWGDLRLGRLQNRIPPRQPQGETCLVGVEGPPLYLEVTDPGRLAAPPKGIKSGCWRSASLTAGSAERRGSIFW